MRGQTQAAGNYYHAQQNRFPQGARKHARDGRESIGWHVLVLPMLEQAALYEEITPLPDGGARFTGRNKIPDVFICPSAVPPTDDANDLESANYVGVAGSGTSRMELPLDQRIHGHVFIDGVLHFGDSVDGGDVTDGLSNTLLLGERTFFPKAEDWTYGGKWYDASGGGVPTSITVGAVKHVVWPINTIENGRAFYVRDFWVPPSQREILNNDLSFGSRHPGGAHFGMADGSVHFLGESLDLSIFRELASRNGGELNRWQP